MSAGTQVSSSTVNQLHAGCRHENRFNLQKLHIPEAKNDDYVINNFELRVCQISTFYRFDSIRLSSSPKKPRGSSLSYDGYLESN